MTEIVYNNAGIHNENMIELLKSGDIDCCYIEYDTDILKHILDVVFMDTKYKELARIKNLSIKLYHDYIEHDDTDIFRICISNNQEILLSTDIPCSNLTVLINYMNTVGIEFQ